MFNQWRCEACGYRLEADVPPAECPGCKKTCRFIDANPYVPADEGKVTGYEPVAQPWQPRIDDAKCTACGACIDACPIEAIEMCEGAAWIDPEICCGDAICVPACPVGAILPPA